MLNAPVLTKRCFTMVSYTDRYITLSKLPYLTLQHIDGAANPSWSTVEDMGVNHRCFYVFVRNGRENLDSPLSDKSALK